MAKKKKVCLYCGRKLTGQRRKYCNTNCQSAYFYNNVWKKKGLIGVDKMVSKIKNQIRSAEEELRKLDNQRERTKNGLELFKVKLNELQKYKRKKSGGKRGSSKV